MPGTGPRPRRSPGSCQPAGEPGGRTGSGCARPLSTHRPAPRRRASGCTLGEATRRTAVCAECGYDLRDKAEYRAPFDVRLPEQQRLVSGKCCNDGVDEMERLAALAGKPS